MLANELRPGMAFLYDTGNAKQLRLIISVSDMRENNAAPGRKHLTIAYVIIDSAFHSPDFRSYDYYDGTPMFTDPWIQLT